MSDQRPVEDFIRAAVERRLTRWDIHSCGGCGYQCGFVIAGEGVFYDSGCWCSSSGPSGLTPRSWADMADHYNRNQPSRNERSAGAPFLDEMRAFWGFEGPPKGEA